MTTKRDAATRALGLLDLTDLNEPTDDGAASRLCRRAAGPFGSVAAVCVWPRFAALCRQRLAGGGVRVATVANFPAGSDDRAAAVAECRRALADGVHEVDVVLPYRTWLAGNRARAQALVSACRVAVEGQALLKVILETGCLPDARAMGEASRDAIEAGAQFIKTSTGKANLSATTEAAEAMLRAIADCGRPVGFKAAGGIRTAAQAAAYLAIADRIMGPEWATAETFRIGASGLLDDLERVLGEQG